MFKLKSIKYIVYEFLGKLILFLDNLINLYVYFVVMACLLSLVPNINYNYPLFHFIFKSAGFYLIPAVFGLSFSPMLVMIVSVLLSMGLRWIFKKYFLPDEPNVLYMDKDQFLRGIEELKKIDKEVEENNDTDDSI